MASRAATNAIRSFTRRLYNTQAAVKGSPSAGVQVSKLKNGITVASVDSNCSVPCLGVAVNAGPRFEPCTDTGINHFLRCALEMGTASFPALGVVNTVLDAGGLYRCTSNREQMLYTMECLRGEVDTCLDVMLSTVMEPVFDHFEIPDISKPMVYDLAFLQSQPNIELFELLHEASYNDGLARSLYAPEQMIGTYTQEQLTNYTDQFYKLNRIVVLGVGVDHEYLVDKTTIVEESTETETEPVVKPSEFKGGEVRKQLPFAPLTYAAVAVEGPSLKSKDHLAACVLQQVMGTGPRNKYSSDGSASHLGKAVVSATNDQCAVSCFNLAYSDSGLFGFYAAGTPSEMDKILRVAFNKFGSVTKDGTITDADIARAKNQLKADVAMSLESNRNLLVHLGEQTVTHGRVMELNELFGMVDSITKQDVANVAKKLVNGKQSMAAIGDLTNTPHLQNLGK